VNVVLVFGLVLGVGSSALAGQPAPLRFAAGAAFGIVYEAANFAALRWWSFPNERLLVLRGRAALTLGVGLAWGLVPLLAPVLAGVPPQS
jgi:hypothetical protein